MTKKPATKGQPLGWIGGTLNVDNATHPVGRLAPGGPVADPTATGRNDPYLAGQRSGRPAIPERHHVDLKLTAKLALVIARDQQVQVKAQIVKTIQDGAEALLSHIERYERSLQLDPDDPVKNSGGTFQDIHLAALNVDLEQHPGKSLAAELRQPVQPVQGHLDAGGHRRTGGDLLQRRVLRQERAHGASRRRSAARLWI